MTSAWRASVAYVLAAVARQEPLVHHLTSPVVMNDTANAALCIGASAVMALSAEEVAEMVGHADALLLNLGTLSPRRLEAMRLAGRRAADKGIPIVLDPVGAGATRFRTEAAVRLLSDLPVAIVRGNAGEIGVLAGAGARVRGVDAVADGSDPAPWARRLAETSRAVVAVTGRRDVVTDGSRLLGIDNGDPLMARVCGTGCMATTLIACCAAVEPDCVLAAIAGLSALGVAGEHAAAASQGPGSFKVALLDALATLGADGLSAGARVSELAGLGAP